jgi:diguanylate cyclase (GGDEF)-like protein
VSRVRSEKWRFSTRVLLPIVAAGAATALLVAAVLVLATRESDRVAWERQSRLVSHVLSAQVQRIPHDQESVTIWDDAVVKTKLRYDAEWVDINLGAWMHDYFGHDQIFVLNSGNEPVYASIDGANAEVSAYESNREKVAPLVLALRTALADSAPGDVAADPARFHNADLVVIGGRPAIASVLPLVSDSGNVQQTPGSEFLHVSVRFLDGSFLDQLRQDYLLEGPRFAWVAYAGPSEEVFPLSTNAGDVLGYFIWQPDRPGWRILRRTAPALGAALFVVGAIVALLTRRLRRASRELEASEAQAQHLAFHDTLTGLPNRALFNDRFDRALADSRRTGAQLAILYLDVDRFKNVNDTLGHPAGDDLIRELARRLTGLMRGADDVSRLGGDEFGVIQTGVTSTRDVEALCERIIAAVAQPFHLLGSSAFVGVSIGVAIAPQAGVDHAELVRKADIALYRAKVEGRNLFRIFSDEMDFTVQRRREIERELREALEVGGKLEVVYQPLYSARTAGMVGVEALLRWHHPTHGTIPPGVFIPIAEEAGLIHELGDWVLREACKAAVRWPLHHVAVNVSAVQFRSQRFAARVLDILRETGMAPNRLELEVTESVLLDSAELSAVTLEALRAAGIRIALDDFGTGYSSLTYLQKYPVDKIKIDRSFVQNLGSDAASDAIVEAMVNLARALRVEVTAEGVETVQQRDALKRIGCDELQGFLLSPPVTADTVDRLLAMSEPAEPNVVASAA